VEDPIRLLARVRNRDVSAFEALYDGHHRLVYGVALRVLAEGPAAEDVTQLVFMKLWADPDAFRGGNFSAWLARVARNRALDAVRARSTRTHEELPLDAPLDFALDEAVFRRLDGERVRTALASLPDEQRATIELGFFGGVTYEEIARRTGTPLGTVKTRIRSGLRRLRSELEKDAPR
jgi:RNA polymerase sigma-70 factor (ECF subfamily)